MAKITKEAAAYKYASVSRKCRDCTMFRMPGSCTLVEGIIRPGASCKYYERKRVGKK